MAKVSSDCSVAQPIIDMSCYWDAATPFGDAFQNGAEGQITKEMQLRRQRTSILSLMILLNN